MKKQQGKKLTRAFIEKASPGYHGDGRGGYGLQLRVHAAKSGHVTRSFRQRVGINGRLTWLGLGAWPVVSLEEARKQALENIIGLRRGEDPRQRQQPRSPQAQPAASLAVQPEQQQQPTPEAISFQKAAEATIAFRRDGWRGGNTEASWGRSLLGLPFSRKPVNQVTAADIQGAVEGDWHTKNRSMRDRLNRISAVLKWARPRYGAVDSTQDVKDALPMHRQKAKHYAALTVREAPGGFQKLARCRKSRELTRLAIRFAALNASRRGEVTAATWGEIQEDAWVIPAARMKAGEAHTVPLSSAALAVLQKADRLADDLSPEALIFPSTKGKALTGSALARCLQVCGVKGASVHGMRRSFRNWCAETGQPREVAEAALAHAVDGVEGHYLTTDMLERRRGLMQAWADYLTG